MRTCAVCAKPIKVTNKRYCSTACRVESSEQAARARGRRPWNYAQISLTCAVCGKSLSISPSRKNKRRHCSRACLAEARRQIPIDHFRCHRCHGLFPWSETYGRTPHKHRKGWAYCKQCHKDRNHQWNKNHREHVRARQREYMRKNFVRSTNTKWRVVGKRVYPSGKICELCNTTKKALAYHHWDDARPEMGMWICQSCHKAAHWLEHYDPAIYWTLRKRLSTGSSES